LLVLMFVGVFLWRVTHRESSVSVLTTPIVEPQLQETITPESDPEDGLIFEADAIATVLADWGQSVNGAASVVINDAFYGAVIAATEPDESFFAASIYKLYVAYEGYRQIDAGIVDSEEIYLNGFTRAECLDKMVRESDSPCAEKLWAELGKEETTLQLRTYGMGNTSMTALTTTASDAAVMLSRIAQGEGLSEQSQQKFLQSMKDQIFRDTLNKSFAPESAIVYNKIGFNELAEYHDVAIVEFPGTGRQLIVSIMTKNVGTANIVRLGDMLRQSILGE